MSGSGRIGPKLTNNGGNGSFSILRDQVDSRLLNRIAHHDVQERPRYVENIKPDCCPLCGYYHRSDTSNPDGTCRAVKACFKRQQENEREFARELG